MSGRELVTDVHLRDEDGRPHVFGPGRGDVPAWAVEKITNPAAWGEDPTTRPGPEPGRVPVEDDGAAGGEGTETPPTPPPSSTDPPQPPPQHGEGSGAPAWRAYAAEHGINMSVDAKRDEIIKACAQAGLPT